MKDELDDLLTGDDVPRFTRWLPGIFVAAVVVGFVSLAWYAYHAGAQSMKDEDLPVVEADKTPIKEKPVDPGGMQFPNQDKTIFETFGNAAQTPPKVERVLPAPEEPMPKQLDTSETTTWINDKLHHDDAVTTSAATDKLEQVIGEKKPEAAPAPASAVSVESKPHQPVAPVAESSESQTESYVAATPAAPAIAPAPAQAPKAETVKTEASKAKAQAPAPAARDQSGSAKAQLGAYRSVKEAQTAWNKMALANQDLFNGWKPSVVKADLGSRGVYYRLRVEGFANAAAAASFCSKASAAGHACIVPSN